MENFTEEVPKNIEQIELETFIIASIETLKRQNMKFGVDKVLKLVQVSLEENHSRESLVKLYNFCQRLCRI